MYYTEKQGRMNSPSLLFLFRHLQIIVYYRSLGLIKVAYCIIIFHNFADCYD